MNNRRTSLAEPFLEPADAHTGVGTPASYRAGYRCLQTGDVICSVELPAEIVEFAVFQDLRLRAVVTPDGQIAPSLNGPIRALPAIPLLIAEPIDALVAQTLVPENLRLEESGKAELVQFRDRLERSLTLVKDSLHKISEAARR